jgi:hypothetical protein
MAKSALDDPHRMTVRNRMEAAANQQISELKSELEHYSHYFTAKELNAIKAAIAAQRLLAACIRGHGME